MRDRTIQAFEEQAERLQDEIDALFVRLTTAEDRLAEVRRLCSGNWFGEPTHRLRQIREVVGVNEGP